MNISGFMFSTARQHLQTALHVGDSPTVEASSSNTSSPVPLERAPPPPSLLTRRRARKRPRDDMEPSEFEPEYDDLGQRLDPYRFVGRVLVSRLRSTVGFLCFAHVK